MRLVVLLCFAIAACATPQDPRTKAPERAAIWSAHVAALSSDAMEGRAAGTPGFERAAAYVIAEARRLGLEPAGTDGYLQPIDFIEQRMDYDASAATLRIGGADTAIPMPAMALAGPGRPLPQAVDAPLVFIGYGLHMPAAGHDDLAGVDLQGKIAVVVSGGPANVPGPTKAHARAQRPQLLAERGAIGVIAVSTPVQAESPWTSSVRNSGLPGMYFADPALRRDGGPFLAMSWDPGEAQLLFSGSNRTFAEIAAAADASQPLAGFDMKTRLIGRFVSNTRPIRSANVVARLPGSDAVLSNEHVVVSAHLDGLGIGRPVNGDAINNGTLDNAAGVAALLDVAAELRRQRLRRSILFVFVTAEEKGLLGARYFARRPTVARESLVADLNYDMALPLFPLRGVTVLGAEESTIGQAAAGVATAMGLPLVPDAFPDRNSFIRSDQYAFIEEGIPSAAFKFGFAKGTPEAEAERAFRATRYHQPSDDLTTPIFAQDEIRLHDFIAAVALRIANEPARPAWNSGSAFSR